MRLQPVLEIVSDPLAPVQTVADALDQVGKRPHGWMKRLRDAVSPRVQVNPTSEVVRLDGRACCAEHVRRYEGRADLELPYEITCPGCGRVFRVKLGLVRVQHSRRG
jgi:hypothetical protein